MLHFLEGHCSPLKAEGFKGIIDGVFLIHFDCTLSLSLSVGAELGIHKKFNVLSPSHTRDRNLHYKSVPAFLATFLKYHPCFFPAIHFLAIDSCVRRKLRGAKNIFLLKFRVVVISTHLSPF